MESGQILEVVADDHGAESDIPALIKKLGHELIEIIRKDNAYHFVIRKL